MSQAYNKLVEALVTVLVGVALVPIVYTFATAANVSATLASILSIIPLLFTIGVLVMTARHLF